MSSKERLLELNARLAQNLTAKGVEATADETTTSLVNKVADIQSGGEVLFSAEGRMYQEHIEFPETVTIIADNAFLFVTGLRSVTLPNTVTSIGISAFRGCEELTQINLPESITKIGSLAFYLVNNIRQTWNIKTTMSVQSLPNSFNGGKLIYEEGITSLPENSVFNYSGCNFSNGAYIYLPSSVENAGAYNTSNGKFTGLESTDGTCTLEVGEGFNVSTNASQFQQTAEKWVKVFENLADRTGLEAYSFIIGTKNINTLTEDELYIAYSKNWDIS